MKLWPPVIVATLVLVSTACAAGDPAESDVSDRPVATDALPGSTATDPAIDYRVIEFDEPIHIDQGAAWDELLPTLAPEFRDVLPDSEAFNPTWWFDTSETLAPKRIEPSAGCSGEAVMRPAGLYGRFQMARPMTPDLYREGDLQLKVLHDDDPAVVADYAAFQATSAECLAGRLDDGASLVRIAADVLPEFTSVAYTIEFERTGPDDDGIERMKDLAVIQLHNANTFVEVIISAIQPVQHPDWTNIEQEVLRIAGTLILEA